MVVVNIASVLEASLTEALKAFYFGFEDFIASWILGSMLKFPVWYVAVPVAGPGDVFAGRVVEAG
jgi:hypothetical protein